MKKVVWRSRAEVYELWLKALRSGEYRQAKSVLKYGSGKSTAFCCLGVLCDLARKDGGPEWEGDGDVYMGEGGTLSVRMMEFMGLDYDSEEVLISKNDSGGRTFRQIAQHIELVLMPTVLE